MKKNCFVLILLVCIIITFCGFKNKPDNLTNITSIQSSLLKNELEKKYNDKYNCKFTDFKIGKVMKYKDTFYATYEFNTDHLITYCGKEFLEEINDKLLGYTDICDINLKDNMIQSTKQVWPSEVLAKCEGINYHIFYDKNYDIFVIGGKVMNIETPIKKIRVKRFESEPLFTDVNEDGYFIMSFKSNIKKSYTEKHYIKSYNRQVECIHGLDEKGNVVKRADHD
ncbi:hypothetical protein [Inediibacterium massiliense]|uniref:hypothetical protein n=1 Tax=Inediibacterium massiliense TaxID=1658111 RepID=UPI0006B651D6|nr:hypothetical protein [Inediibacterium massiliense]